MGQRIAVVGGGISGLGAAWALHQDHEIVVYEAADHLGGHSNTVDVETSGGPVPVDTGFIVFNETTYPHLTRLFAALGVLSQPSDMSFSFSRDRSFEYAASALGLLAQPTNLLEPRYRSMIGDILRFRTVGPHLDPRRDETIGELLARHGFGPGFLEDYLLPMTAAIWSARDQETARFPAMSILRFLGNHGLIRINDRPSWSTVRGGSRAYVRMLAAPFRHQVRLSTPVTGLRRDEHGVSVTTPRGTDVFDQLILATHSDQALAILGTEATDAERDALGAIGYQPNVAVLHSDPTLMPVRRRVWSSWNAMATSTDDGDSVTSVTYWMNRLQRIDPGTPLFVSLNPTRAPDPALVHGLFEYAHPQFDSRAVDGQRRIAEIQGLRRTWFAGAYCGYGFHEDGLQAGLNVAAALGSPPIWWGSFEPRSSALPPSRVGSLV